MTMRAGSGSDPDRAQRVGFPSAAVIRVGVALVAAAIPPAPGDGSAAEATPDEGRRPAHPPHGATPAAETPDANALRAILDARLTAHHRRFGIAVREAGVRSCIESVTVYCPSELVPDVRTYYESYWESGPWPYEVDVVAVDELGTVTGGEDPAAFRAALASDISERHAGACNYVMLIGDANDHPAFDAEGQLHEATWGVGEWADVWAEQVARGAPRHGQPGNDVIPSFLVPDTDPPGVNLAGVAPYLHTDKPYVPGGTDMILTRLPVDSAVEFLAWAYKEITVNDRYLELGNDGRAARVLMAVGDVDHRADGEGAWVAAIADSVAEHLSGESLARLDESALEGPCDRNAALIDEWGHRPELFLIPAAVASDRYAPGTFADERVAGCAFDVWQLDEYTYPPAVMLAAGAGDFARTETRGSPVFEDLLGGAWRRGSPFVMAPVAGIRQATTARIATTFVDELLRGDRSRSLAEIATRALERVVAEHAGDSTLVRVVSSIALFGSPLTRWAFREPELSAGAGDRASPVPPDVTVPNPFATGSAVHLRLPDAGHVELVVYDVMGRRVRTLARGQSPAGHRRIRWDARDDDGRALRAGAYYVRLTTRGRPVTVSVVVVP